MFIHKRGTWFVFAATISGAILYSFACQVPILDSSRGGDFIEITTEKPRCNADEALAAATDLQGCLWNGPTVHRVALLRSTRAHALSPVASCWVRL